MGGWGKGWRRDWGCIELGAGGGGGGGRRGPMDVCLSQRDVFQEATPIDNDVDLVVI